MSVPTGSGLQPSRLTCSVPPPSSPDTGGESCSGERGRSSWPGSAVVRSRCVLRAVMSRSINQTLISRPIKSFPDARIYSYNLAQITERTSTEIVVRDNLNKLAGRRVRIRATLRRSDVVVPIHGPRLPRWNQLTKTGCHPGRTVSTPRCRRSMSLRPVGQNCRCTARTRDWAQLRIVAPGECQSSAAAVLPWNW